MPDKCLDCPAPSADMDGFIVSGPGGVPRADSAGSSASEGPFAKEAPQTGHLVIMGTLGADGNPGSLPDVPKVGWAYVAEDAGTYGGVQATEGDMVYCMSLNPTRWGVLQADSDDSGRDLVSVSASMDCESSSGQFSPYYPRSCQFYGYDYAGDEPVPVSAVYSVDGSSLYFEWLLDAHQHAVVVLDGVPVDVPVFDAEAGSAYEGMADGRTVRLDLVSKTRASSRFHFSFDVSAPAIPVLSLTSTTASGETTVQEVDMSCLVPPVFDGSNNGLVPAGSSGSSLKVLCSDGQWRTLAELSGT